MSDTIRDRVLVEALPEIPDSGFSGQTLEIAAERAGVSKRELKDAFPQGPASLVEAFSHWADKRMGEIVAGIESEKTRDRVASAVRARIEVLGQHKEAARRAAGFLAAPQHAGLALNLMARSVDQMWRAAGDKSSDFSYYTKRATLGAVYAATLAYWFTDSSEGHTATWTFLGHRIDDVMRLGKFTAAAREALAKLPDPFGLFSGFRDGRR